MPQYKYCKCYRILHKLKGVIKVKSGKKRLSICHFTYILSLKAVEYMVNRTLVQPLVALIMEYGPHKTRQLHSYNFQTIIIHNSIQEPC